MIRTQAFLIQNIGRDQLERFNAKGGCAPTLYAGPDTEDRLVLSHRGADAVLGRFDSAVIACAIDEASEARLLGFEYIAQTFVEALMRPLVPSDAPEKLFTKPTTPQKF